MNKKKILSVEERESRCYDYFHTNGIVSRAQLREKLKEIPIPGVRISFVEDMFSDFILTRKLNEQKKHEITTDTKLCKVFAISDVHIPFHDEKTVDLVFQCIINEQPDYLVLCGDILDCYSISKFTKKPDRVKNLQTEINIFYKLMRNLIKHIPNTEIHYVLGNHEDRLETLILNNPGLFGLDVLEPQNLFRLNDLGIHYHKTKVKINDYIYYHGDAARKDASYSAKAEFIDHKMNDGISGHTHRLGSYYTTYEQKVNTWIENGCLCTIQPDYLRDPDKANWQQGFSVIYSYNGVNQPQQILINNHSFVFNNHLYK